MKWPDYSLQQAKKVMHPKDRYPKDLHQENDWLHWREIGARRAKGEETLSQDMDFDSSLILCLTISSDQSFIP